MVSAAVAPLLAVQHPCSSHMEGTHLSCKENYAEAVPLTACGSFSAIPM